MSGYQNTNEYEPGGGYVLCQRSGHKVRRRDTVLESRTRLRVHKDWADPEHPQDFVRGVRDKQTFRRAASEPADQFLEINEITEDSF